MIFVNKIDVAHTRGIADARSIDAAVVADGLARGTQHAEKTKLTTEFNLVVGNVAHVRIGFTNQTQAMSRRCDVSQTYRPRKVLTQRTYVNLARVAGQMVGIEHKKTAQFPDAALQATTKESLPSFGIEHRIALLVSLGNGGNLLDCINETRQPHLLRISPLLQLLLHRQRGKRLAGPRPRDLLQAEVTEVAAVDPIVQWQSVVNGLLNALTSRDSVIDRCTVDDGVEFSLCARQTLAGKLILLSCKSIRFHHTLFIRNVNNFLTVAPQRDVHSRLCLQQHALDVGIAVQLGQDAHLAVLAVEPNLQALPVV